MTDEPYEDDYDYDYPLDDEDVQGLRERLENLVPNVFRRTVNTGRGAAQLTEDAIRGALGEMRLPKEAVTYIIEIADTTKKEVVGMAAREFREFLDSARFNEELAKVLTQLSFEIRTEIRFIPNDQALRPSVSSEARLKRPGSDTVPPDEQTAAERRLTEGVNEAIRTGASEVAEMLLARVLRDRLRRGAAPEEGVDGPPDEAPDETPEPSDEDGDEENA